MRALLLIILPSVRPRSPSAVSWQPDRTASCGKRRFASFEAVDAARRFVEEIKGFFLLFSFFLFIIAWSLSPRPRTLQSIVGSRPAAVMIVPLSYWHSITSPSSWENSRRSGRTFFFFFLALIVE